jgi:hypothetical protein
VAAGLESPYRVPAPPDPGHDATPRDRFTMAVMVGVLALSLTRVGLFLHGFEPLGADPVLAIAASSASAYALLTLLRRRPRARDPAA